MILPSITSIYHLSSLYEVLLQVSPSEMVKPKRICFVQSLIPLWMRAVIEKSLLKDHRLRT